MPPKRNLIAFGKSPPTVWLAHKKSRRSGTVATNALAGKKGKTDASRFKSERPTPVFRFCPLLTRSGMMAKILGALDRALGSPWAGSFAIGALSVHLEWDFVTLVLVVLIYSTALPPTPFSQGAA